MYHVWVARVTQGKGGAKWGEEDREHIIFFLNTDLISCNTNMQRNTAMALKTKMEPQNICQLPPYSAYPACIQHVPMQLHTMKSTGGMPQNI